MAKLGFRMWLLIILIIASVVFIINWQSFGGKVIVKEVIINSTASELGMQTGEVIKQINGVEIHSIEDYSKALNEALEGRGQIEFRVVVNVENSSENLSFIYLSKNLDFDVGINNTIILVSGNAMEIGLEEGMRILSINNYSIENYSFIQIKKMVESKLKIIILTDKQEYIFLIGDDLGLIVSEVPRTRIKVGLDLQGGARALVEPERPLDANEMAGLLETVRYRLNVYGLTDVNIKEVSDLTGNRYMVVELAGATPQKLQELIGEQGKFEAKVANETLFIGGNNDITFVCKNDASCAYIEQCNEVEGGQICRFHFEIHLSEQAAKKHANVTAGLEEGVGDKKGYLNESLQLYLDDKLVDELLIAVDLKGQEATRIAISGSASGSTRSEAYENTQESMKKLQTVLITGSLPFKLEIVKLDSISPLLGKEFTKNVFIVAIAAFLVVCIIIYLRYRRFILFVPVIITLISEALLVLAIAAVIGWNLDLASIAGIIAAIGTGVDDQIIMIDEMKVSRQYSIKQRIKRAFFIIFGAYATTALALIPLWSVGAGLLRGFVVTTLLGITVGVFITRPAFAEILRKITKD